MPPWLPYCGEAPSPDGWATNWNLAPELLLTLAGALVAAGMARQPARRAAGLVAATVFGALYISPFCALGSALFLVRIIHDLVLAIVLAPLLAVALRLDQARLPGTLTGWTVIHVLTFLLWHAPDSYAAAMSNDLVFWLMQFSLTGTAAGWWTKVYRAPAPVAAAALLATMIAMGLLGALFTFSRTAFFAPHWLTVQQWGLTPISDQQIAGLLMWAPGSLAYLLAAMAVLHRWLGRRSLA